MTLLTIEDGRFRRVVDIERMVPGYAGLAIYRKGSRPVRAWVVQKQPRRCSQKR
jgi:hypothetical protein